MASDLGSYLQFTGLPGSSGGLNSVTPSIAALGSNMPELDAGIVGQMVESRIMEDRYWNRIYDRIAKDEINAENAARIGGGARAVGGIVVAYGGAVAAIPSFGLSLGATAWGIDQGQAGVRQAAGEFGAESYGGQFARDHVGGWAGSVYDHADVIAGGYGLARVGLSRGMGLVTEVLARRAGDGLDASFVLFRRKANTGAFAGLVIPMQMRQVRSFANSAGIGLKGIKIKIVRNPELVGKGYYGSATDARTLYLYPEAFSSPEQLVKTLAHERTHNFQISIFGSRGTEVEALEEAAVRAENDVWQYYLLQTGK